MRLRIQKAHHRIELLDEQCADGKRKISSIISQDYFDSLLKVIDHNVSTFRAKIKARHCRKLTDIGTFETRDDYVDKDRWVINLSDHQLSTHEPRALRTKYRYNSKICPNFQLHSKH